MADQSLLRRAVVQGEAIRLETGALVTKTGKYTGRCPDAKFFVCDEEDELARTIDWKNNSAISSDDFRKVKDTIVSYLEKNAWRKQPITQTVFAGADKAHSLKVNITTELICHAVFVQNMFVEHLADTPSFQEWNLLSAPGAHDDPKVLIDLHNREILITGTYYAGEIKKAVFTVMNYLMPARNVLPMHCSVNSNLDGSAPAIFFGLSGTGKTTLSSDHGRTLIGDDEHGWSPEGLFNFEGGCYAKVINLSKEDEPQIWAAAHTEGSILENVVVKDGKPDFTDATITENTRASYDISAIADASSTGVCSHPTNVIFLTCDAFGVLPPVSRLTEQQAIDHFCMGYTAKVAGTEAGVKEPTATFSHCFGAPFMPLDVSVYAKLLQEKITKHSVNCWLVNTGWAGGGYGKGERMPISVSRTIVRAIVSGELVDLPFATHEATGLSIPLSIDESTDNFLVPEALWPSAQEYNEACAKLMQMFADNLKN